jgi:hypothetical protein
MLFAKLLLALSVFAASEAFNILTPENQNEITGLIASLLTPEDKRKLLQLAYGHQNKDNALRSNRVNGEVSYSVSVSYLFIYYVLNY